VISRRLSRSGDPPHFSKISLLRSPTSTRYSPSRPPSRRWISRKLRILKRLVSPQLPTRTAGGPETSPRLSEESFLNIQAYFRADWRVRLAGTATKRL
jgi:hypothetical protein